MSTVEKALGLLGFFTEKRSSIGLTEFATLARHDKATTRRLLLSLSRAGFVEQDRQTRAYRLGAAVVRLARVREATFPIQAAVEGPLRELAAATGETAHFSLAAGQDLATLGLVESTRANCVRLERGEALPMHATASGIAYLAFAPPEALAAVQDELPAFTSKTVTSKRALLTRVDKTRSDGWTVSRDGFEEGVFGLAAPVFGADGFACGAIAVAAPVSRATAEAQRRIRIAVVRAAAEISRGLGAAKRKVAA
jgi:DNA-binding IclR family transcriptional regulator